MTTKPKALGANCFAGGFTVGMCKHFDILAHFECGTYGVETSKLNFPDLLHYTDAETWPIAEYAEQGVDVIYGNPPCAIWSVNNKSKVDWREDSRIGMIRLQFDLLEQFRPKVWVWESVTGAYNKGRAFVDELTAAANLLGYNVSYVLFDAHMIGLPHRRKRFFFVAHNIKIPWSKIRIQYGPTVGELLSSLEGSIDTTVEWDHFSDMVKARDVGYIEDVQPGQKLRAVFDKWMEDGKITLERNVRGHVKGRPSWSILRLPIDDPAPTFTGKTWMHPTEQRPCSYDEYKAIAGYPADFKITKARGEQRMSLLARGVMPIVADWLGSLIRAGIDANEKAYAGKTEIKLLNFKQGLRIRHWHPQLDLFVDII